MKRISLALLVGISMLILAGTVQSYPACSSLGCINANTICKCSSCSVCEDKVNKLQICDTGMGPVECYCDEVSMTSSISSTGTCIDWTKEEIGQSYVITLNCNGNSISNSQTGYGIFLDNTDNNVIKNCKIREFLIGIYVEDSDSNTVENCEIYDNVHEGIYLEKSIDNVIGGGNKINNNDYGVVVFGCEGTTIEDNEITLNSWVGIEVTSGKSIGSVSFGGVSFDDCICDEDGIPTCEEGEIPTACDFDGDGIMDDMDDLKNILWTGGALGDMASIGTVIKNNDIVNNSDDGVYIGPGSITSAVSGNTIQNNSNHGIYVIDSHYNVISGNSILDNGKAGIYMSGSSTNGIQGNDVTENGEEGIYMYSSNMSVINNANTISSNAEEGVYLYQSDKNEINGNSISGNNVDPGSIGLDYMAGIRVDKSSNNTIKSNTISDENLNGICLKESDENVIDANTIEGSQKQGIYLYRSDGNNITGPDSSIKNSTENGIFLKESDKNSLKDNTISGNGGDGIKLDDSNDNKIMSGNSVTDNAGNGIYLDNSDGNWMEYSSSNDNGENGFYLKNSGNNQVVCMNSIDDNEENGVLVELGYGNTISINDIDDNGINGIYLKNSQGNRMDQNSICNNGEYDIKQSAKTSSGDDNQCENVDNWDDDGEEGCTTSCGAAPAAKVMVRKSSPVPAAEGSANVPVGFAASPPSAGGIPSLELLGILIGIFALYLIIKVRDRV